MTLPYLGNTHWHPHRDTLTVQLHMPVGISSSALETPGRLPNQEGQSGRSSIYIFHFSKVCEAEVEVGEAHLSQKAGLDKKDSVTPFSKDQPATLGFLCKFLAMPPACFTLCHASACPYCSTINKKNTQAKYLQEGFVSVSIKAVTSALRSPRQASIIGLEKNIRALSIATQHGPPSPSYEG